MRKSEREVLLEQQKSAQEQSVELDIVGLFRRMLGDKPEPTQWDFICDSSDAALYMGRAGAAKTSTLVSKIFGRCLLEPNTKAVIMRQDYNDMYDTVIQRAEEFLNRLSPSLLVDRNKSPPMRWWIRCAVNDEHGNPAVSQITFSGINDLPKGFEAHIIGVDEADECDEKSINALRMRLRAPGPQSKQLILACNPPDTTHWLYTAATGKDQYEKQKTEPWLKLFVPQDGENATHLPEDYYSKAASGMPEDLRQRFIHGEWGQVFEGAPVYREFGNIHISDDLKYNKHWPVLRFRDFGYRRPCVIWAQLDEDTGGVNCLRELLGENEEVTAFEPRVQMFSERWFPRASFIDFGDPAVDQHKDTGSTLHILSTLGVDVNFVRSDLDESIRQVRLGLERIVKGGRPQLLFSRKGCPILIRALRGGYRMNENGTKPLKDQFYDHLADAFRYGYINIFDHAGGLKALPQTSNYYEVTATYGRQATMPTTAEYDPRYDNE